MKRTRDAQVVELGKFVRRRREGMRMTLEQLAERSGLSPNYIGMIENGKRDPSLTTVCALAKGLDMEPGELLGPMPKLGPEGDEVARMFDGTPDDLRGPVLAVLHAVPKKRRS